MRMREGTPKIQKPAIRVGWPNDMTLEVSKGIDHYVNAAHFAITRAIECGGPVWCSWRRAIEGDNTHITIGYPPDENNPRGSFIEIPIDQLPPDWREEARRPLEES